MPAGWQAGKSIALLDFVGTSIVGTPEECVCAIERYQKETRVTHLAMGMHLPGLDPAKVMHSMELFAREVMPHFRH